MDEEKIPNYLFQIHKYRISLFLDEKYFRIKVRGYYRSFRHDRLIILFAMLLPLVGIFLYSIIVGIPNVGIYTFPVLLLFIVLLPFLIYEFVKDFQISLLLKKRVISDRIFTLTPKNQKQLENENKIVVNALGQVICNDYDRLYSNLIVDGNSFKALNSIQDPEVGNYQNEYKVPCFYTQENTLIPVLPFDVYDSSDKIRNTLFHSWHTFIGYLYKNYNLWPFKDKTIVLKTSDELKLILEIIDGGYKTRMPNDGFKDKIRDGVVF